MYTNDKDHRITLRLNNAMFDYVRSCADSMGVSPSEFLRMVITASMAVQSQSQSIAKQLSENKDFQKAFKNKEVSGRENDEISINDKL